MSEQTPSKGSAALKYFSGHLTILFFGILLLFTKYEWMNILGIVFIFISLAAFFGFAKKAWKAGAAKQTAQRGAQQRARDRAFKKTPNAEEIAASNMKYYFSCAVYAWIFLGDDAAYYAALTVGKVFDSTLRKQALDNLERVDNEGISKAKEAKEAGNDEAMNNFLSASTKMINLYKAIGEKEWTLWDITKAKLELDKIDHEYNQAIMDFDTTVFDKRYPDEDFERLIIK